MLEAASTTCRHGAHVAAVEVISLDAITPDNTSGVVEGTRVPANYRHEAEATAAALTLTDPHGGYRINQIHADGCAIVCSAADVLETPAEFAAAMTNSPLYDAPRPAAAPAAEVAPAPTLEPVTVTEAQARAYRIADKLRAAHWSVHIVIEDRPEQRYASGGVSYAATRSVTVHATRRDFDPQFMVSFVTTVRAGGRRTTRLSYAHTATSRQGIKRLRTLAAVGLWVTMHADTLNVPAREWIGERPECNECGAEAAHRDGCRGPYATESAAEVAPAPALEPVTLEQGSLGRAPRHPAS